MISWPALLLAGLLACGAGTERSALDEALSQGSGVSETSGSAGTGGEGAQTPPLPAGAKPMAPPPKAPAVDGPAPPVVLVWAGIGDLHKSFFSDTEMVSPLQNELHGKVAPPANVHIRFSDQTHKGSLQLQLLPETLTASMNGQGGLVPLQNLTPITAALASYRSKVAARFDLRIYSFKVGIETYRGAKRCYFGVAGGPSADGQTMSHCVDVNGEQLCGVPEAGGVRFSGGDASQVRACLK